jgi:quercetin dioxygenase-like cupin family protein
MKSKQLEAIRLVLPAGKTIPPHKARGEITVHCLEGRVLFSIGEVTRELTAGDWLYLQAGEVHALSAPVDSSLLVTLVLPA